MDSIHSCILTYEQTKIDTYIGETYGRIGMS